MLLVVGEVGPAKLGQVPARDDVAQGRGLASRSRGQAQGRERQGDEQPGFAGVEQWSDFNAICAAKTADGDFRTNPMVSE
jgi:hypothetical protein